MADFQALHPCMGKDIFQSKLSKLSGDSLAKYRRSLAALDAFLLGHGLTHADLSAPVVDDWAYELMRQGKSRTAVAGSLNILSGCLKDVIDERYAEAAKRARELARRFEASAVIVPDLLRGEAFNTCLAIIRGLMKAKGSGGTACDVLLFSLLNGCMPVEAVVAIRKDSLTEYAGQSRAMLERNADARRAFIFDLKQSYRTPRQIVAALTAELAERFAKYVDADSFDLDEFITSLWVAMAVQCGARASEALACVGGKARYAAPDFLTAASVDLNAKERLSRAIDALLEQAAPHWYAMQMRRGVTFAELQSEIAASVSPAPMLFYPCELIAKNINNRRVLKDQPFITQTVFFKMSPEAVLPMFAKIGDKAWCYRMFNSPAAPYAIIPKGEMHRFQTAIGQFTPDMEIHPIGELPLRPDDKVVLLMADFYNQEAKVSKVLTESEGATVYRVVFRDKSGFEWSVNADTRQLKLAN
ncbi:MAG: hypothetical protein HDS72_08790 [Bacteroidales bacterium]|nr:hypothetical protein [Bacteroidales bacterium]